MVRGDDVVELRRREVFGRPRTAAIGGDRGAAVVAFDHPVGVVWRDPEIVRIAVRNPAHGPERLAAVSGLLKLDVVDVHDVLVLRVRVGLHVVPRALRQRTGAVGTRPRGAGIVAAVHAAFLRFDDRVHAIRVGARHGDTDVAPDAGRQPGVSRDLGPGVATVSRLEHPRARSARPQLPRPAVRLPQSGVQHARVVRVHHQVHHARGIVAEENLLPRAAAILGTEDAALGVGTEHVTQRADVHEIRVGRMHHDVADVLGVAQTHEPPCATRVGGLPHTVAVRSVAADRELAAPDVDDVGVGRSHANGANGAAEIAVRHGAPCLSAVGGLEDASAGGAHPVLVGAGDAAGNGD